MGEKDFAALAPNGSVRCPSDTIVVVGCVFSSCTGRSRGKDMVMCLKELLCHFRRGSNNNWEGTEFKVH